MLSKIILNMSPETIGFIAIISVFTLLFHWRYTPATVYKAPPLLTTLGILGTFIGIAIGLLNFDANNVEKSVPALIAGIKTAVWASAWGIFCAITIKVREIFFGIDKKITAEKSTGASIDDMAALLTAIEQSLTGVQENSLLTQLMLARQDSNDRLDKLGRTLEAFCEKLANSNSSLLVEGLKDIVQDFNGKIQEQFGGNLQALSQDVKSANATYKEEIKGTIENYNQEFNKNIQETVDQAKNQIAEIQTVFGDGLSKSLEAQGKELATLSQNLIRVIRQVQNDAIQSLK